MIARWRPLSAIWLVVALSAPRAAVGTEYSLGVVPQFEQRKLHEHWRPIADEIERRTGHRIRLVTTLGVQEFERATLQGAFDLAYLSPYALGGVRAAAGYVLLVRDARPVAGILVVRKGGGIRAPRELAGRTVAFPTPNAVGACMLMRAELKRQLGVEVRPVYVKSVSNVALYVAKGLAEAGGVPEKAYPLIDADIRERLEIIHRTQPIAPHAIAAHTRVPPADREAVRRAILELAATAHGKELLSQVPMERPIAAAAADYAGVAELGLDAWYEPVAEGGHGEAIPP